MNKLMPAALVCLALLGATGARAQSAGGPAREAAQFDFMLGQWEVEVLPKINSLARLVHGQPKLQGSWKAWRSFDGYGVDDELRVVDSSGNPATLAHAQRIYDAPNKQWLISTLDVDRARFSNASAAWLGGEMRISGSGTSPDGRAMLTRSRFYEIGADGFKMQQDRSYDDGKTWDEATLLVEAKRVAATAAR